MNIKYIPYIIIIILLFVSGYLYYLNSNNNMLIATANQNIIALNDTLTITRTKNGDLIADKVVLVSKNGDLKDLNSSLADEVKDIEGKVVRLTNTVIQLKNAQPIYLTDTFYVFNNDSILVKWQKYEQYDTNNYRKLRGETTLYKKDSVITNTKTILYEDVLGLSLTTGLREIDDKITIFVTSKYPGFNVTKLEGAEIDPDSNPIFKNFVQKKKPWGIGVQVGGGFGLNGITPYVGVGISYNIIRF